VRAVVGGGSTARTYIRAARELGVDESALDELGIAITRVNARVLLGALPDAYPRPAESFDEALLASRSHPIVVMGGTHPGHTTDAVATMLAEKARAHRLVIATNVDGVYDRDPRKHPDAKLLSRLSAQELVHITRDATQEAGSAGVIDPTGVKILARSGLECRVVNGRKFEELRKALLGEPFHGSVVEARGRPGGGKA